jgi:hypothetical protein
MSAPVSADTLNFLDRFDASTRDSSVDVEALFGSTFLALDPGGVHAVTPALLAKALPARRAMFEKAGVRRVVRTSASETRLDDMHRLVTVEWSAERASAPSFTLKSTFLLRAEGGMPRVVVYLNHVDVVEMLAGASAP